MPCEASGCSLVAKRGPHQTLIQRSRSIGAQQKAEYQQVQGAGKSHVKRKFMGLTSEDKDAIRAQIGAHIISVVRSR